MTIPDWQVVQKILDRTGQQADGEKAREIARVLSRRIHLREREKLTNTARRIAREAALEKWIRSEELAWHLALGKPLQRQNR
jgi:hypothetical protein